MTRSKDKTNCYSPTITSSLVKSLPLLCMKFLSFFHQAQNTRFGIPALAIFTFVAAYLLTFSSTQNENLIGNTEFNKTLHKKELLMNSELDTLLKRSYKKSFDDIFKASPSEYKTLYRDKGLALLIYEGDTLKFWSDNAVSVENYMEKDRKSVV